VRAVTPKCDMYISLYIAEYYLLIKFNSIYIDMIANHGTHRISTFQRVPSKQTIGLSQPQSLLATKQKLVFSSRRSSANASCSSTSSRDGNNSVKTQAIRKKVPRTSLNGGQLLEVTGVRP
jgi:hypothetical protein